MSCPNCLPCSCIIKLMKKLYDSMLIVKNAVFRYFCQFQNPNAVQLRIQIANQLLYRNDFLIKKVNFLS